MKIGSHAIFSNTAAPLDNQFPVQDICNEEEAKSTEIEGLTGLCPELLLIIQDCNTLACREAGPERRALAEEYLNRLQILKQCCPESTDTSAEYKRLLLLAAECLRLGTILYIHYRIMEYVCTITFIEPSLTSMKNIAVCSAPQSNPGPFNVISEEDANERSRL
jgi:hypothetical protein